MAQDKNNPVKQQQNTVICNVSNPWQYLVVWMGKTKIIQIIWLNSGSTMVALFATLEL